MAYTKTTWVNDSAPYLNATNLNKIEQGIQDAHTTADTAVQPQDYPGAGPYFINWNGAAWEDIYTGSTTAVRPASIPAYPTGWAVWVTVEDDTFNTPPPLAATYDQWVYHKDVTPVSA